MSNKILFQQMLKLRRVAMGKGNRTKTKHPRPQVWLYPHATERKYGKGISKVQRGITKMTTTTIGDRLDNWLLNTRVDGHNIFKADTTSQEITEVIAQLQREIDNLYGSNPNQVRALVTGIAHDVNDFNNKQFQKSAVAMLGVEFVVTEAWELEVIEAWADNNYNLIKSLSDEYIKVVNTIVSEGVQFGKTYNEIMREIRAKNKQITGYRSRLIARDQVGKLNGVLTQRRMSDVGVDKYTWLTASDERVRASHKALNNKLCRWDSNNKYSTDGGKSWIKRTSKMAKAIPGQEIQCRCTAIPFFDEVIEEIDTTIEGEG